MGGLCERDIDRSSDKNVVHKTIYSNRFCVQRTRTKTIKMDYAVTKYVDEICSRPSPTKRSRNNGNFMTDNKLRVYTHTKCTLSSAVTNAQT